MQHRPLEELALEYPPDKVELFARNEDAPIDDRSILFDGEKMHLTETHKPMALLNTLKQKEKNDFLIEERSVQRSDPIFGGGAQSSMWYTEILIN